MLEIKNLHVEIETDEFNKPKKILKGIDLKLEKGKVYALMGPNGSGKSTFAEVLMGNPKYKISKGDILIDGNSILKSSPDERAKKGIFLSFQNPVSVPGVNVQKFLRQAYNSLHSSPEKQLSILEFNEFLKGKAKQLGVSEEFLNRYLNDGFSGGEKKKMEILQLLVLNPKIAVLDETDSGLDIDSLKIIAKGINAFKGTGKKISSEKEKSVLIITHYKRILNHINPDEVFVMMNGKIILSGKQEILEKLEEKGYGWVRKKTET